MMDTGAHFHRCDFQVHTPRDLNFDGKRPVTDDERRAYARAVVAACRAKGLEAVALTDHHDIAFFKYTREAALTETDDAGDSLLDEDRLVVFPGMELTLGIPCQALIIFDADLPAEFLPLALPALGITPTADVDETPAPVKKLDIMDFTALYKALMVRPPVGLDTPLGWGIRLRRADSSVNCPFHWCRALAQRTSTNSMQSRSTSS